jgi:hypothetical protein
MKLYQLIAASALVFMIIAGCTTTGIGHGEMTALGKPAEPVLFSWKSMDGGISGTIMAKLPDAVYEGKFFQITHQTQSVTLAPMWNGWIEGWGDWPYWSHPYPYIATQFITYYSGQVVANLENNDAQHMRCRFHLANPASGMTGGGQGECQLSSGRSINATF